jgi:ProP effector
MNKQVHDQILATIETLALAFPKTFHVYQVRRKPLKIGIFRDLITQMDGVITPKELSVGLRYYCGSSAYLRAMAKDAWRVDLDGNPAGSVTANEAAEAKDRLARMAVRQQAKGLRKEDPSFSSVPEQGAPKKLGLADLKAAWQERMAAKEAAE